MEIDSCVHLYIKYMNTDTNTITTTIQVVVVVVDNNGDDNDIYY